MKKLVLTAVLCVAGAAAWAGTDAATAEMLLRKSGLWEQLASMAPQVRSGLNEAVEQASDKPSAEEVERLMRVASRAYDAQRLRQAAQAVFVKDLDARHVTELRSWFEGRVGQSITRLEEAASADDRGTETQLREGIARLADQTPERRAMLEDMVKTSQSAQLMLRLHTAMMLAARQGAAAVAPADKPVPGEEELRRTLRAQEPQLLQVFGQVALAGMARTYDALPTEDRQRYLAFLKSEAGLHFTQVSTAAFEAGMSQASGEFGRGMVRPQGTRGS